MNNEHKNSRNHETMWNDFPSCLTCIFYIFSFFIPGKQPYFEISVMITHTSMNHAPAIFDDFAGVFLSPGVNIRAGNKYPGSRSERRSAINVINNVFIIIVAKYKDRFINDLKKALSNLKSTNSQVAEIKYVSRILRNNSDRLQPRQLV